MSAQTCVTSMKNDKGIRESSQVRPKHKYYYCWPIWVRIPPPSAVLVMLGEVACTMGMDRVYMPGHHAKMNKILGCESYILDFRGAESW